MNTTTTRHKRYDENFKRTAVEHWMLSGQSATRIAEELMLAGPVPKNSSWKYTKVANGHRYTSEFGSVTIVE